MTGAPQHDECLWIELKKIVTLRRPQSSRFEGRTPRIQLAAGALLPLLTMFSLTTANAEEHRCVRTQNILWGDGRHDDTVALNAWLKGEDAVWADSGRSVGPAIAGHTFRLSSAIYVIGGTGRRLSDFRLVFPERGEVVTGGTVRAGGDPDKPPISAGITITGGDSGEGVPFDAPEPKPVRAEDKAACPIS